NGPPPYRPGHRRCAPTFDDTVPPAMDPSSAPVNPAELYELLGIVGGVVVTGLLGFLVVRRARAARQRMIDAVGEAPARRLPGREPRTPEPEPEEEEEEAEGEAAEGEAAAEGEPEPEPESEPEPEPARPARPVARPREVAPSAPAAPAPEAER